MDDDETLRAGVSSLLDRMRGEERLFAERLTASERDEQGSPTHWSARATLAHIADFKAEQIVRLEAVRARVEPPELLPRDHSDPELYAEYAARDWNRLGADGERTATDLREHVQELDAEVLCTPGAFPWLRGRALWAQVLVRGVWHPSAHLHQYLAERGQFERVVELQESLLGAATSSRIPDVSGGRPFALYNLACARSLCGELEPALTRLEEALRLDPTLAASAQVDADLAALRTDARFDALVAAV